jgi:hypothetical protein
LRSGQCPFISWSYLVGDAGVICTLLAEPIAVEVRQVVVVVFGELGKLPRGEAVFPNRSGGFLSPYLLTDGPLKRPLERGASVDPIPRPPTHLRHDPTLARRSSKLV